MKEKDCSKCYIITKKYTYIRGIILFISISASLMIPIANIFIAKLIHDDVSSDFWEDMWYDYVKTKVKQN